MPSSSESELVGLGSGCVLVVEDSDHHALVLVSALRDVCAVLRVAAAQPALDSLRQRLYDAVVCDWHLQVGTTAQVLSVARAQRDDVLCIAFSADPSTRQACLDAGAHEFVLKEPGSYQVVVGLVDEHLRGRAAL